VSALEEIEAAIERLTEVRDRPQVVVTFKDVAEDQAQWFVSATEKLWMFHATIDAQLTILQDFHDRYSGRMEAKWTPIAPMAMNALTLARAILGASDGPR
jgi:hypothetical protein